MSNSEQESDVMYIIIAFEEQWKLLKKHEEEIKRAQKNWPGSINKYIKQEHKKR